MTHWFTYIARCADQSLYTGVTDDLAKRELAHNAGKGAKYTRARLPLTFIYSEQFPDRSSAQKREAAIKKLTRPEKLALIAFDCQTSQHPNSE